MRPPNEHVRRFIAAIRSERLDLGDAARRAGLTFSDAANVWAFGSAAGKLRFVDKGPGDRWIEEGEGK